jgi:hypothetical protein
MCTSSRVAAGDVLILRIAAYDQSGVSKVFVRCFQFSMTDASRMKVAVGEAVLRAEQPASEPAFVDVKVRIPHNAGLGNWGIQLIEFTNGKGYKHTFYRGQGKFDDIAFEVVPPLADENGRPVNLGMVQIAGSRPATKPLPGTKPLELVPPRPSTSPLG